MAEAPASGASDWLFARDREAPPETEPGARSQEPLRFADHRLLGQLLGTYLLLEGKGGLLLLDQHAGHERVLYERLREGLFGAGVERQALLIAETIELAASEAAALEAHADAALRLGFELEPFGESAVLVRAMPALLADRDPGVLVRQLAAELATSEGARAGGAELRRLDPLDRLVATLACHAARRAGDVLDPREQAALLTSLDAIPWAPTCPHGRPVAVPLPLAEIERRFGRR